MVQAIVTKGEECVSADTQIQIHYVTEASLRILNVPSGAKSYLNSANSRIMHGQFEIDIRQSAIRFFLCNIKMLYVK